MARETEQQKRERALMASIARGKAQKGYARDVDVAMAIGVSEATFCRSKKKGFQNMDVYKFGLMARKLGLTGREVCAALGVTWADQ